LVWNVRLESLTYINASAVALGGAVPSSMLLKLANIRLELGETEEGLHEKIASRLGMPAEAVGQWRILRKSLDARRHDDIHFTYAAAVNLSQEDAIRLSNSSTAELEPFVPKRFEWPDPGSSPLRHRPVIVGSGPAGLFAGYLLAGAGYRPLILERGRAVKERVADVRRFDDRGPLDPESNYLFGEGGAGTFSDGKLTSRGTGPDVDRVLEILADCHGKPSIVYEHRPHLGSNRLPLIVRTLRRKFESLGGEIQFSCRVEDLRIADGRICGVDTSSGFIAADVVILATGHSARDTYAMLLRRGVPLAAKPFQLGVRIEQPQSAIDVARYGHNAGHPALEPADYSASIKAGGRELFTFCMCAGGYVMPSVSDPGYYCTNGMSESRHDSPFANSGLVVTIDPRETGSEHPLAGIHLQQRVERLAYLVGNRSYQAPLQWARDFLSARPSRGTLPSSHRRGSRTAELGLFLPPAVSESLMAGLPLFNRRFAGQFLHDATLTGPESRGSSPVRITRDPVSRQSPGIEGLYPCGEGAGYAGGIVSAAVDGLRTARVIVAKHSNRVG
jgi:uncharacterized FAD-dependent dehydrogenase